MKEKIQNWFYELINGHSRLLKEEVDIICETRFDEDYKWMNDYQIQRLIQIRIKEMYKKKFHKTK